jgi:hypothetical protein
LTRATKVYGSSKAAWYQNGQYFDSLGNPISHEEAAQPNPEDVVAGIIQVQTEPAHSLQPPTATVIEVPVAKPPVVPDEIREQPVESPGRKAWGEDKYLKLKAEKPLILARMVLKAGGTPASGYGSKRRNIEWLLENTD